MLYRARDLISITSFGEAYHNKPYLDRGDAESTAEPVCSTACDGASKTQARNRYPLRLERLIGRITELSGPAALEASCGLLREVQRRRGVPFVWILAHRLPPFAPDLAANGIDPQSIPFVFAPQPVAAAQAAERCLRSRAFELVLLDLTNQATGTNRGGGDRAAAAQRIDDAALGRLLRLCRQERAALLALTDRHGDLAGSLVFTRFAAARRKGSGRSGARERGGSDSCESGESSADYEYRVTLAKSKTGRPGAVYREVLRGPHGML